MTLRAMRPAEAALFAALEAADRPYPWSEASFISANDVPSTMLVWEESEKVFGYAALQVVDEEAYLTNLMVPPPLRRCGIGGELLQKVMMWAREKSATRLLLDVAANNAPAVRLYERFGFRLLERRTGAYPRGEDALLMKKDL